MKTKIPEGLTITDAQLLKIKLQLNIDELLNRFESDTGLKISNISVLRLAINSLETRVHINL